jgi:trimeric autotransporter adhesin
VYNNSSLDVNGSINGPSKPGNGQPPGPPPGRGFGSLNVASSGAGYGSFAHIDTLRQSPTSNGNSPTHAGSSAATAAAAAAGSTAGSGNTAPVSTAGATSSAVPGASGGMRGSCNTATAGNTGAPAGAATAGYSEGRGMRRGSASSLTSPHSNSNAYTGAADSMLPYSVNNNSSSSYRRSGSRGNDRGDSRGREGPPGPSMYTSQQQSYSHSYSGMEVYGSGSSSSYRRGSNSGYYNGNSSSNCGGHPPPNDISIYGPGGSDDVYNGNNSNNTSER